MKIGTIREKMRGEHRVGITPKGAKILTEHGHSVFVQKGSGEGSGYSDDDYEDAGAIILSSAHDVAAQVDVLVKVKGLLHQEYDLLHPGHLQGKTLCAFHHLAGVSPRYTEELLQHEVTAIAYETIEDASGAFPLLRPMSAIAGAASIQIGAQYLQKQYGGSGITLAALDLPEVPRARVVVVGGGVAGSYAAQTAANMGANVALFENNQKRLEELQLLFKVFKKYPNVQVLMPSDPVYSEHIARADLLIGAVSLAGARAAQVVTKKHVNSMKKGSVIIDIAIDQGGCVWRSQPINPDDPIHEHRGVIYCSIANIPGQFPMQSTPALTEATLPYILRIAENGVEKALRADPLFLKGLHAYRGWITNEAVARDLEMLNRYREPRMLLEKSRNNAEQTRKDAELR